MNFKKCSLTVVLLAVFSLLTGCFEFEERIVINRNGSGTLEVEYWTLEDVDIHDDNFEFPKKENDIRHEIKKKYTSRHVKLVDLDVNQRENSRTVYFKVRFDDVMNLNEIRHFQENEFSFRKSGDKFEFSRVVFMNNNVEKKKDEPEGVLEDFILSVVEEGLSRIKFRFEIETPYEIKRTNADWTQRANRAVWKYNLADVMYQREVEMRLVTK